MTLPPRLHRPAATFQVALALGSNLDRPEHQLRRALSRLGTLLGPLRVATLYRTRPVSPLAQPDYLNTALLAHTVLRPEDLLALAKALELEAGRRPHPRHGPRPLDVDLLLYDDLVIRHPELTLPHPRLRSRRFYLAPLAELDPELPVPPDGITVGELLRTLEGEADVVPVGWTDPL